MLNEDVYLLKLGEEVMIHSDKEELKAYEGIGGPIEEINNRYDKATVTFRTDDYRLISADAEDLMPKYPANCYSQSDVIGEPADNFVNLLGNMYNPKLQIIKQEVIFEFLSLHSRNILDQLYAVEKMVGVDVDGRIVLDSIKLVNVSELTLESLFTDDRLFVHVTLY